MVFSVSSWLETWQPAASWGVAFGTAALALATAWLARRAHQEGVAAKRQVELQAEQISAAARPVVVPVWDDSNPPRRAGKGALQVTNVGTGPALNLYGSLFWSRDASAPTSSLSASALGRTALGAGRAGVMKTTNDGVDPVWPTSLGFLRYRDVSGQEWQTHFRADTVNTGGSLAFFVVAIGKTSEYGLPQYTSREWLNQPPHDRHWLWRFPGEESVRSPNGRVRRRMSRVLRGR